MKGMKKGKRHKDQGEVWRVAKCQESVFVCSDRRTAARQCCTLRRERIAGVNRKERGSFEIRDRQGAQNHGGHAHTHTV